MKILAAALFAAYAFCTGASLADPARPPWNVTIRNDSDAYVLVVVHFAHGSVAQTWCNAPFSQGGFSAFSALGETRLEVMHHNCTGSPMLKEAKPYLAGHARTTYTISGSGGRFTIAAQ